MRKGVFFTIAVLFSIMRVNAQDPQFNNVQHSLVYLNPSFSGSSGYLRAQGVYRNQWPNLSGTNVYYNTTVDGYIKSANAGVSFSAFTDNIARGLIRQNKISLAYAQYLHLEETDIIPSVQLNYGFNSLQTSRMNFPYGGYPQYGLPTTLTVIPLGQVNYFDLSAGILVSKRYATWGIAVSNILQPNISFAGVYKVPVKFVAHASNNIAVSAKAKANLFAAYTAQGNYSYVDLKVINTYDNFFLWGAGYRIMPKVSPVIKEVFRYYNDLSFYLGLRKNALTFMYSYDLNISKLYGNTAGSHEISISLSLRRKDEQRKLKKLENF
jgi:type IX secretion system PorP/SprF family membrane protein